MHEAGMGKYSQFKKRVLEANLSLVGIGTGLAWTFAGNSVALDFAYGGAGGLIYMSLLQHGADALPLNSPSLSGKVILHSKVYWVSFLGFSAILCAF